MTVPFGVLSSSTMTAHASWFDKFNPIPDSVQKDIGKTVDTIDELKKIIGSIIEWFKNFKENITNLSTDFMSWSYDFLAKVVLHTPSFLFDSAWLKQNTLTFTGLAIAMSVMLVIYEGFQRMAGHLIKDKDPTEISRIYKRIPAVIGFSALAPTLFYYGFKGLNWVTDVIIDLTKAKMVSGFSTMSLSNITYFEIVTFIAFDIALVGMMIPVLLQNFRRWFELLILATISPLAITCWVFRAHEHMFRKWWYSIKKRALNQLVYAVYLLIIGTLMFGTKTPDGNFDILIKLGVLVGGLYSMANPPQLVKSYLDKNQGVGDVWDGASKAAKPHPLLVQGALLARKAILKK